jgi:hypothetical protein
MFICFFCFCLYKKLIYKYSNLFYVYLLLLLIVVVNMSRTITEVYDFDTTTKMPDLIKPIPDHKALAREKNRIVFETHYSNCEDKCAICLSNMINATVKHTPCGHTFHLTCLTKWQKFHNEINVHCPNCRADLPSLKYMFPFMETVVPQLVYSSSIEHEDESSDYESSEDELIAVSVNLARTRHIINQELIDEINAAEEPESERESTGEEGDEDEYGRSLVQYDADF